MCVAHQQFAIRYHSPSLPKLRVVNGRYESFTVRVWARGSEIVRGEVQHVLSGESMRFVDLNSVLKFLSGQVGIDPAHTDTELPKASIPSSGGDGGGGAGAPEGGAARKDTDPRAGAR